MEPNQTRRDLENTLTSYWECLTLRTACQLDLFDHIEAGVRTSEDLNRATSCDAQMMDLLVDGLLALTAIQKTEGEIFLSEKGSLLTSNHPMSLKQATLLWGGEHLTAWQSLKHTLRTGKAAFENIYHQSFFDFLAVHPERLLNYQLAMDEYARNDYRTLGSHCDFSVYRSLMDVGGGLGALLRNISPHCPQTKLLLFDLPEVIELVPESDVFEKIKGDFLQDFPSRVDGIFLSRILHDWPDQQVATILKNCYQAILPAGKIFVLENLKDQFKDGAALLSLNMAVMCESFERSGAEYRSLLHDAGFRVQKTLQINEFQSMIIAEK